ncbi:MAG: SDR family oxidoreductase [Streptosporangiales bacterium]|nr:SDR family oxidoreductase [Streptosporangiales bacterium]
MPETRWALVTGGSGGLGAETAVALAARGFDVVVAYGRRADVAEGVAERVRNGGVDAATVRLDLDDPSACAAVVGALVGERGAPSAVVHVAGALLRSSLADTSDEALDRIFRVNVFAPFAIDRTVAPGMRTQPSGGSIIHVASVIGPLGSRHRTAYAASKSALIGLTRALAVELAPTIRVNCVLPGLFDTEMNDALRADPAALASVAARIPQGRLGRPAECGAVVAFLADNEASYVTGTCLEVDGGLTYRLAVPSSDSGT